jgi:hypothetical protein
MADTKKANGKSSLSRGKLALIAILAVVLVGVLYIQFGGGSESVVSSEPAGYKPRRPVVTLAAAATPAATTRNTKAAADNGAIAGSPIVDEARWKSPNLSDVIDHDPFALPATFPKPELLEASSASGDDMVAAAAADDAKRLADAIDQLQRQLAELQQLGVQVVVRERDQYVAMVGDRTLHVGDEIKGFIVTEIDPQEGVRVERKGTE